MNATHAYYEGALQALRFIEARHPTGRRFGEDADARWSSFRGDLALTDRIDLMIRDADAQWPGSFGARTVFARRAVAEDEPFGKGWEHLDPVGAEELWRRVLGEPEPKSPEEAIQAIAAAHALDLEPQAPGPVHPAEQLVVSGPNAIAGVILAFSGAKDLDWAEQVTVVATPPAHRQLAAFGGALLRATKRAALILTHDEPAKPKVRTALVSADATPEDAARANELAKG